MFVAVDQSDSNDHFVVGSFWLPLDRLGEFESRVLQLRCDQKYWREVHFVDLKKAEGRAFDFMKALLEIALGEDLKGLFAVLVADNNKERRQAHFDGSYTKRDAAFMYELISRRYRWWNVTTEPYVIFDDLTNHTPVKDSDDEPEDNVSSEHASEARKHLERYIGKKVACFSPCRSHISSAVQLADVIAGMTLLRWSINSGLQNNPNSAKLAMLEWFEQESGKDLGIQTTPSKTNFNVWRFKSS